MTASQSTWLPRHRTGGRPRLTPQPPGPLGLVLGVLVTAGLLVGTSLGSQGAVAVVAAEPTQAAPMAAPMTAPMAGPVRSPVAAQPTPPAAADELNGAAASQEQVVAALRSSLAAADAGLSVPRRTRPGVDRLRRSLWQGPLSCGATAGQVRHDVCVFGDPSGATTVVALGSSHMTMWMSGLDEAAAARDARMLGLIKFGCVPYDVRVLRDGEEWTTCARFREWAISRVAEIRPDLVIVGAHTDVTVVDDDGAVLRGGARAAELAAGAGRLAARLTEAAGRVVVLGDVTVRPRNPQGCLRRTGRSFARCETTMTARHRALADATAASVSAVGAEFVDASELTCVDGRCPVAGAGRFLYRDVSHVSRVWSEYVGGVLASKVGIR